MAAAVIAQPRNKHIECCGQSLPGKYPSSKAGVSEDLCEHHQRRASESIDLLFFCDASLLRQPGLQPMPFTSGQWTSPMSPGCHIEQQFANLRQ